MEPTGRWGSRVGSGERSRSGGTTDGYGLVIMSLGADAGSEHGEIGGLGGRSARIKTIGDQDRCETYGGQSSMGMTAVPNRVLTIDAEECCARCGAMACVVGGCKYLRAVYGSQAQSLILVHAMGKTGVAGKEAEADEVQQLQVQVALPFTRWEGWHG